MSSAKTQSSDQFTYSSIWLEVSNEIWNGTIHRLYKMAVSTIMFHKKQEKSFGFLVPFDVPLDLVFESTDKKSLQTRLLHFGLSRKFCMMFPFICWDFFNEALISPLRSVLDIELSVAVTISWKSSRFSSNTSQKVSALTVVEDALAESNEPSPK